MIKRLLALAVAAAGCLCGPVASGAAPAPPVPTSPADGSPAEPADVQLCATVSDPDGQPLDATFFARDLAAPVESNFTIIALPDTQYLSQMYPGIYLSMTRWIVEQRAARNIVFVTHEGDIVQVGNSPEEWDHADAAMSLLEDPATTGLAEGIPYGLSVGNHDQFVTGDSGAVDAPNSTTPFFNQTFGVGRFQGRSYWGGTYDASNDNGYQLFTAGGMDFIIFHHEFDDKQLRFTDGVLDWTRGLLRDHRHRRGIVTSHSILCTDTDCPDFLEAEFSNQGAATYDALKDVRNLFLILCGHAGGALMQPRRADTFDGHTIHTLLANYQRFALCPYRCGKGYLRILEFRPAQNEIFVQTYSPWLDEFLNEPCTDGSSCHEFTIPYDMEAGRPFRPVGAVAGVADGAGVCVPWNGRSPGGQYEWYVDTEDPDGEFAVGERRTFTSSGNCVFDTDCDEGDVCTDDVCDNGTCSRSAIAGCCVDAGDCDDGNYCTDDVCQAGTCDNPPNALSCSDGNACTLDDVCSAGACVGQPLSCDDGNACTEDTCTDGVCSSELAPVAACCTVDDQCDDGNPCTLDFCDAGGDCAGTPLPDCCNVDADCNDGSSCTADVCPRRNDVSASFDGVNDFMFMGRVGNFNGAIELPVGFNLRRFTIELWFKWDGGGTPVKTDEWPAWILFDQGGVEAIPLVTKGKQDREDDPVKTVGWFLGIDPTSGKLVGDFEEPYGPATMSADNHPVESDASVTVGVWQHAALTYDGRCWQIFLDGQPQTDGTNCPDVYPEVGSLQIPTIGGAADQQGFVVGHYSGRIDEVRIWDRARTQAEIDADRFRQIEQAPRLVGRYGMDLTGEFELEETTDPELLGINVGATIDGADVVDMGGGVCENRTPYEVPALDVEYRGGGVILTWLTQPPFPHDVLVGSILDLRRDGGFDASTCLVDNGSFGGTVVDTTTTPARGDGVYYLVRMVSGCESGTWGPGAGGADRVAPGCPD